MENIIRTDELANGVRVEFVDQSNRYFGDYHRLRIEVRCRVAITESLFAEAADPHAEAGRVREMLGAEVLWVRHLERMGVAGSDLDAVRGDLIATFAASNFPYLQSREFPARLVERKLAEGKKPNRLFRLIG